jgi:hypothetical protein|tara:strand:- start:49 stop:303 length:255 start_codon:yes stop_codon:yes gene_type:complete
MNLTWFYFHCVLAMVILVKDYNGTLEESLNNFEKSIGLYTEVDTADTEEPPFYIPPIEEEIDSTWILPEYEGIDLLIDSNKVKA